MCTLAVLRQPRSPHPLVVAANRDEALGRASSPPRLWDAPVRFVAGRDEVAGGTWLGLNAHGIVVGLTNHWTDRPPDAGATSRGHVVRDLLQATDLDGLLDDLGRLDPRSTNPFLLVVADRSGRAHWASSEEGLRAHSVEDPVFAIGNLPPAEDRAARARRLVDGLSTDPPGGEEPIERRIQRLQAALAHHGAEGGPLDSVCVHTDRGYGTVSSSILLLGRDPVDDRWFHAPGPPCRTAFEDVSELLAGLPPQSR